MFNLYHFIQDSSKNNFWGISETGWVALSAVGTFLAVFVALTNDWLRELIFKPNIQPVESKITLQDIGGQTYLYYRFIIKNSRKGLFSWLPWPRIQAKGVRVLLTYRNPPDNFIPIPLNWTHFTSLERNIPPDEEVYIDILRQKVGDPSSETLVMNFVGRLAWAQPIQI